jgi:hypothetical protein
LTSCPSTSTISVCSNVLDSARETVSGCRRPNPESLCSCRICHPEYSKILDGLGPSDTGNIQVLKKINIQLLSPRA